ncbi:hypothetical protein [Sphingobium sp. CR28]
MTEQELPSANRVPTRTPERSGDLRAMEKIVRLPGGNVDREIVFKMLDS